MNAQLNAQQAAMNQNYAARRYLLKTGTPMRKHVATIGPFAPGAGVVTQQLLNVGVLTSLDAVVTAQITIATTATPSKWGALNFLRNITFTDYTTQTRVNASHRGLNGILSARHGQPWSYGANFFNSDATAQSSIGPAPLNILPTAVVTPAAANFRVPVHIPIAYDPANDLRGAILAQTIRGLQYVSFALPTAAQVFGSGDDAVYTAGTGSVAQIFISIYQNYIQPANMSIGGAQGNAIPLIDCTSVYEINTQGQINAGLAPGQIAYINYPNARQVLGAMLGYNNGGAAGAALVYGSDLTSIEIWANANVALRQWDDVTDLLDKQRSLFNGDYGPGYYYLDSRRVNINTVLYGQVQVQLTPKTVNAGAYAEFTTESFYLKGTALPGVAAPAA